jgi:hypothetical protein
MGKILNIVKNTNAFNYKKLTIVAFLNNGKAFDKVWHEEHIYINKFL